MFELKLCKMHYTLIKSQIPVTKIKNFTQNQYKSEVYFGLVILLVSAKTCLVFGKLNFILIIEWVLKFVLTGFIY